MRGAIEFADWILRKLKVRHYLKLREKNVLVNTPHRWLLRIGALFVLLLPVIILIHNVGFSPKVNCDDASAACDNPGYGGKAFAKTAFFNFEIKPTWNDALLAFGLAVFIQFTMSIVLNLRYGQGAFCRILCPYAPMMVPLMNISPGTDRKSHAWPSVPAAAIAVMPARRGSMSVERFSTLMGR